MMSAGPYHPMGPCCEGHPGVLQRSAYLASETMPGNKKTPAVNVVISQKPPKKQGKKAGPKPAQKQKKDKKTKRDIKGAAARLHLSDRGAGTAKSIIANFLSPMSAHGFRWPRDSTGSNLNASRTGTACLQHITSINQSSGYVGTYADGNEGSCLVYQFRNVLRAAVMLTRHSTTSMYRAIFDDATETFHAIPGGEGLNIAYLVADDAAKAPHGPQLFGGSLSNASHLQFIWCGVGDTLSVIPSATAIDTFSVFVATRPGSAECKALKLAEHTFTDGNPYVYTAPNPGYYALSYVRSAATTSAYTYAVHLTVAAGDCLSHIALPNALEHATWLGNIRLLGSSLLLANEAAKITADGNIAACMVVDDTPFYEVNTVAKLARRSGSQNFKASNGLYAWLKPSGAKVFDFREALTVAPTTGVVTDSGFALDDACAYNVVVINCNANGSTYSGLNFLAAFHWNVEYKTNDIWAGLEYSTISPAQADEVESLVVRHDCFTHNPVHLEDIRRFMGASLNYLRRHGQIVGRALSAAFPAYGPLIRAGADAFSL